MKAENLKAEMAGAGDQRPVAERFVPAAMSGRDWRRRNKPKVRAMKRELTDHKVNGLNEAIRIGVLDDPGSGGANHHCLVQPIRKVGEMECPANEVNIVFQDGPIQEVGVNGVSQEALMAVVIDRLRSFQAGPLPSRETAMALTHAEESLMWMQKRTRDRMARGVEGTMAK